MADCESCARPQPDTAYVCAPCAGKLHQQLHRAAGLVPELDTAVARLARFGEPGPRSRGHAPAAPIRPGGDPAGDHEPGWPAGLPVNLAASQVRDDVANTVSGWCRVVAEERYGGSWVDCLPGEAITGLPREAVGSARVAPGDVRSNRTQAPILDQAIRWLAGQLEWARHQRWAGECWDELGDAARSVERAVDRPAERRYMGACGEPDGLAGACPGELYAHPSATTVRCPTCSARHQVAERRAWLDGLVTERAYTAAEIEGAYPHVRADRIRQWGSRGQIVAHGADRYGRPLWPLREVLDLAARTQRPGRKTQVAA